MNKSESIKELATALAKFQGDVKQPLKDAANPFFKSKYVPLENVVEAITDIAPKHGLSFIQYPVNQDDKVGVKTLLMHSSGEWLETEPIYAKPGKNDAQATGSVITYLKRYSLSAVFGITSDEDDDGNKAVDNSPQPKKKAMPKLTEPQKAGLKLKWSLMDGKEEVFDGWLMGELSQGKTHEQLDKFLATKLIEKQEKEGAPNGQ